jgi:hypothetical protein
MKGYYVTLQRGERTAWLLGPFKDHQRAKDAVREATAKANELDPRVHFDAYGTSSMDAATLPPGKLNSILPHLVVDA